MSTRTVEFLKFALVHIVFSVLTMILLIQLAEHRPLSGGSVGSALGTVGMILVLGPLAVIVAGYLAWIATRQNVLFPQSGFGLRLPVYVVLAFILFVALNYAIGGLHAFPFELVMYVPAAVAFVGAQFAASASFRTRIVRTDQ